MDKLNAVDVTMVMVLAEVENSIKSGWDSDKGLWFSHYSLEGGEPTIAYGHKLSSEEFRMGVYSAGIDQREAVELLLGDYTEAYRLANLQWNLKHSEPIRREYRHILGDIVFNSGPMVRNGIWKWPKLAMAMKAGDDQGVYRESIRWYRTTDGVRKPLTKRSAAVCRALGLDFDPKLV